MKIVEIVAKCCKADGAGSGSAAILQQHNNNKQNVLQECWAKWWGLREESDVGTRITKAEVEVFSPVLCVLKWQPAENGLKIH